MSTRNLTVVINKQGKTKVAQFGQYDGYPEGQGLTALSFLRDCNPELFNEKISKIKFYNEEEDDELIERGGDPNRPWLFEDGAEVLRFIMQYDVDFIRDYSEFAADSLFCEWAYVIDLQKGTFEVYKGFNEELLRRGYRFFYLSNRSDGGYQPVKQVHEFDLNALPSDEEFLETCSISAS